MTGMERSENRAGRRHMIVLLSDDIDRQGLAFTRVARIRLDMHEI